MPNHKIRKCLKKIMGYRTLILAQKYQRLNPHYIPDVEISNEMKSNQFGYFSRSPLLYEFLQREFWDTPRSVLKKKTSITHNIQGALKVIVELFCL